MPEPAEIIAAVYSNCHVRVLEDPAALAGAIMTALRAEGWAFIRTEGTFTEWGVRDGAVLQYDDEDDARKHARLLVKLVPSWPATVVSRQVWRGPWAEAPQTTKKEDGDA